ncbi:sterol-sensing domain of SREBP cleavage-activation-domain-containing protein [Leucosporidium creatinivorum]|uniref:Sterol-sensing domain of SREBP cleavage-activation-domain-containing protein n=1 Tax=Leucosporidium creatinivorum TaxID=106004 RepID=A0A1Y2D4U2_9BASI|nr:sterol-sensing domain of SREBP cleavage-activation-domain-containing protein [Leucosporidium creatinivorum]
MAPSPASSSPSLSASTQLRLRPHSPSSPSSSSPSSHTQPNLLTRLTNSLNTFFHSLGLLLSSHQIPSLLLCALLICTLLAPSLISYFTPASSPSSRSSLQLAWDAEGLKRQGLIQSEDQVCWDRLARYYKVREIEARVVRVEQVLVGTAGAAGGSRFGGGALTKSTLHRAMLVQNELERRLLNGEVEGLTCVREDVGGGCAIGSPLRWWESEERLLRDGDVHATLSLPAADTKEDKAVVPLTSSSTLVGIGRDRQGLVKGAHHLAITFYLLSTANTTSSNHLGAGGLELGEMTRMKQSWRRAVREVVDGKGWEREGIEKPREKMGKVTEARGKGRRVILKHLPHLIPAPHPRALESFLFALGYLLVILYIRHSLSLLGPHVVNSMPGLILTGVVQLMLSGIMSLSVVGLVGWDTGLVPWNLMAFLVLVCGVDNMLVLTHAVSLTDIRLPIPQRLATGLSAVGLSSTVTLLAELVGAGALLLVIDVQVIRQLIVFAAVVLVVDFFLEMTFFATILSIDIQRLELADLLTQGHKTQHRHLPSTPSDLDDGELLDSEPEPSGRSQQLYSVLAASKTVLRDRAARTTTFGFLFLIDALLYSVYGPDHFLPAFCSETALSPDNRPLLAPSLSSEISRSLRRGQRSASPLSTYPAEQIAPHAASNFWRLLNPNNHSSAVHLQLEPVTAVQLFDDGALAAPESLLAVGGGIVEPAWWTRMGMILLPIIGTIVILYILLLYLLKDAELLESERERKEKERGERRKVREGAGVEGKRLVGAWRGDVELLASSAEAVVSWAGLDDRVVLWRRRKTTNSNDPTFDPPIPLEIPLAAEPPSLTLLAIDPTSRFCAAATTAGRILIWSLERRLLIDFSPIGEGEEEESEGRRGKIGRPVALFAGPRAGRENERGGVVGPPSRGVGGGREEARFCSVHQSGVVVLWDCIACTSTVVFRPPPTLSSEPPSPNSTPPLPPPSPSPSSTPKTKTSIITPSPCLTSNTPSWPIYARHSSTGRLTLYRADPSAPQQTWTSFFDEEVTTSVDPITALACGEVELGGAVEGAKGSRGILVVGTLEGMVSLYSLPLSTDSSSSSTSLPPSARLSILSDLSSPIRQLRLAPTARRTSSPSSTPSSTATSEKCPTCAQLLNEGFIVTISSRENLQVLRVSLGGGGGGVGVAGFGNGRREDYSEEG